MKMHWTRRHILGCVLAALPALGEGRVCDYCEARGLCRKDDLA